MNETNPNPEDPSSAPDSSQAEREAAAKLRSKEQAQSKPNLGHQSETGIGGLVGILAAVGLIAAGWYHTFAAMWLRWFPAWGKKGLTFTEQLTEGDSYYSHGPLVPLTSLLIAYFIHKRVGMPCQRTRSSSIIGWLMLLVFMGFHLLSVSPGARVMFVSGFALIGVIGGLILIWGGWPLAKAYWLPVTFLFFMVPMPEVAIVDLNFKLKFLAGRAAMWLTTNAFNVPAVMDGSYIYLAPDEMGEPKTLVIDSVCSGLRSLISLVWFASLFAMVCRAKGLWRVLMLALAVPVAILCNTIRITTLNVAAHYGSVELAGPGGWVHDTSGILVFAIALAVLFAIEAGIVAGGHRLKRDWSDPRLMGFLEKLRGMALKRSATPTRMSLGVLTVAAGLSLFWTLHVSARPSGTMDAQWVPETITINGETYTGQDRELDQLTLIILETPDYLLRRYSTANHRKSVDLLIVFSANNRKGTHPPEVCIEGGGSQIVVKQTKGIEVDGLGDIDLREIMSQKSNRMSYFLYTYKCGSRYTPSFFAQQFWIFANGLLGGNTSGALVRFSVPVNPNDPEPAKQRALDAARALMPQIDQGLLTDPQKL